VATHSFPSTKLFKLLIYQRINGQLFLIEKMIGEDDDSLRQEASERHENRDDYLIVLAEYKQDAVHTL
jgi:hypothetical protein